MDEKVLQELQTRIDTMLSNAKGVFVTVESVKSMENEAAKLKAEIESLKAADKSEALKVELDTFKTNIEKSIVELAAKTKSFEKVEAEKPENIAQILERRKAEILEMVASRKGFMQFDVKAPKQVDSIKTLVQRSAIANNTVALRLDGIGQLATPNLPLIEVFGVIQGMHPGGKVRYIDQKTVTRNAAAKAEGAAAPESAVTWEEFMVPLEKVLDSIPVTWESLQDFDFIQTEIENILRTNVSIKVDDYLINGTGVSPEAKGLFTYATAFNAGAYAGEKTTNPSLFDLMVILKTQISNGKAKYSPDFVLINSLDALKEVLHKTGEGVRDNMIINGTLAGLRIIEHSLVPANTLMIGDSRYVQFRTDYSVAEIEIGTVGTQFTEDKATVKIRKRILNLIRNADVDGFLKVTDIDAALAAITGIPS